jgi:uncharacterized membrane protein
MIKVAAALNSFASEPEATAPPSEEIFVLSASQLSDLITQAIERATAPLMGRLSVLEREVRGRGAEGGEGPTRLPNAHTGQNLILQVVQDLRAENMALKHELEDLQEVVPWIEALSKKMARLQAQVEAQEKKPQPLQKDRGEILRALIAANGGKMLAKESRKKMHLSKAAFSVLLSTMKADIETKPYHLNKSAKVLILR